MISMEWMNLFGLYSCARYAVRRKTIIQLGKNFPTV